MNELIQAITDAVATGILGNAAYDVAKPIFQKFFPGKQVPMHDRQALFEWLKQELGNDEARANALQHELTTSIQAKIKGDGNIVVQGINQSTVNINYGENAALPQSLNPKHDTIFLTPYTPIPDHERPLGRDEDLKDIARRLQEAGQLVVVKGLGGIGKSTLARYYVDSYRHEYRHIAWVKVANGLPAGFSQDSYLHRRLNLDLSQIPHESDRFSACLAALEKLEGPNLLVLDNAVQDAAAQTYRSLLPKAPRWHVLLTSRHELNGYSKMELDKLSNDAARQLFERSYQKPLADETWQELYALTDGHALSLELFGKSLHKTLGQLGPDGLIQRLKEKRLDDPVLQQRIASGHSGDETTVYEHLLITFNLSEFGDYVIWLFKQFVALPLTPLDFEDFKNLLRVSDEDDIKLTDALILMEATGWLQRDDDAFFMHPMIQQVVYYSLKPKDKDVESLIENVTAILELDETKDNPVEKFSFIPFGETLLGNVLWINNVALATLQNNLATIYQQVANYSKAEKLFNLSLDSDIDIFGEKHSRVAIRRNNLANLYIEIGNYKKAINLLKLALLSDFDNFGENHPTVAICMSNLAMAYNELGEINKACELLEQVYARNLENFGDEHPLVARCMSNLGTIYSGLGEFQKARLLLEKALTSDLKNFGERHPNVANRYNNLAIVFFNMGKLRKARELFEKALASDLENFGKNHPIIANRYNNLAATYQITQNWRQAYDFLKKANEICVATLSENHPDRMAAKENLDYAQAQLTKRTLPSSQLRKKFTKPRLKK